MFSTKPAASLRTLFARYHEPPSISQQQSKKLLDGLKDSFRKELDREYGSNGDKSTTVTASATAPTPSSSHSNRHSAANQHLTSILSNPLFSYNKNSALPTFPTPMPAPKRDPMNVFDHAVSRGMMNLNAATGCLMTKQNQMTAIEPQSDASANSDVALRVVRWLRSSGAELKLNFLDNRPFVQALVPFLVAEKMDDVAWEWVTRALYDTPGAVGEEKRISRASFLLAQVVRVKSQPQYGNLDAAITTILQAEELLQGNPLQSRLLVLPWRSVSWLSTVEAYSRTVPSEQLFDAHLETAKRLRQPLLVEQAHLHLHHPTHPSYIPAMEFFKNKEQLRRLVQNLSADAAAGSKSVGISPGSWIAYLGHDTINFLTKLGMKNQAQDITDLLTAELSGSFKGSARPT